MTKTELLRMLEPFDDDLELLMIDGDKCHAFAAGKFAVKNDGEGVVALVKGDVVPMPRVLA